MMKQLIILVLCSLFSANLIAQDCQYEYEKGDKFDDEEEKLTEAIIIARKVQREGALPLRKVMAQLRKVGVQQYFVLKFPVTMIMSPTFTDSDNRSELVLLLDNKKKITLPLAELMQNVKDKVEFRYATDFVLMEEDLALLKKHRVTDMRVGMKNNTFDVELEQDAAEMLMESMSCID